MNNDNININLMAYESQEQLSFKMDMLKREINHLRIAINSGDQADSLRANESELDKKRTEYLLILNKLNIKRGQSRRNEIVKMQRENLSAEKIAKLKAAKEKLQFTYNDKYSQPYKMNASVYYSTSVIDTLVH